MSQIKKSQDLLKKVECLMRENNTLRKKLSKLRKVAHTGVNYTKPMKEEVLEAKQEDFKECDYCRGEIKKIIIHNLEFEVCQQCKSRHRVK